MPPGKPVSPVVEPLPASASCFKRGRNVASGLLGTVAGVRVDDLVGVAGAGREAEPAGIAAPVAERLDVVERKRDGVVLEDADELHRALLVLGVEPRPARRWRRRRRRGSQEIGGRRRGSSAANREIVRAAAGRRLPRGCRRGAAARRDDDQREPDNHRKSSVSTTNHEHLRARGDAGPGPRETRPSARSSAHLARRRRGQRPQVSLRGLHQSCASTARARRTPATGPLRTK